jgi:hypothetical protein
VSDESDDLELRWQQPGQPEVELRSPAGPDDAEAASPCSHLMLLSRGLWTIGRYQVGA